MPDRNQEIRAAIGPLKLYFVRLPDDDRMLDKVIAGVMLAGAHTRFLRCAFTVDQWEKWAAHPRWDRPIGLMLHAKREDPGVVLNFAALVPLRELPKEEWPPEYAGEEWRGAAAIPEDAVGLLPIGMLVRYASKCHHPELHDEMMCMLKKAVEGETKEPWEQGLSV